MIFLWACTHARGIIYSHPPVALCTTPPRHTEPPTQTMFARGPVVAVGIRVWYRSGTLLSIIVTTPAQPPTKIAFSRGPVSCHPSAEGNFIPRRYVPSSPPLEGWAQPGVVRDFKKTQFLPLVIASKAWRSSK